MTKCAASSYKLVYIFKVNEVEKSYYTNLYQKDKDINPCISLIVFNRWTL